MEIVQNRFAFFANFAETIQELPEEKRAKAYQAICEYGIYGILPDDESLRMMCFIARTSIFKEDGRKNNGGNHNPTGRNQHSAKEEVKVGQSGQSWSKLVKVGQSLSETETEAETEIKEKRIKKKNICIDTIDLGEYESIRDLLNVWLDYKKSKKQAYANDKSIIALAKRLWTMANGDAETARKIIDQSMANNWAGLFPVKQEPFNPDDPEHFKL